MSASAEDEPANGSAGPGSGVGCDETNNNVTSHPSPLLGASDPLEGTPLEDHVVSHSNMSAVALQLDLGLL